MVKPTTEKALAKFTIAEQMYRNAMRSAYDEFVERVSRELSLPIEQAKFLIQITEQHGPQFWADAVDVLMTAFGNEGELA